MAYFTPDRCQHILLPPVVDDYVGKDDPVRVYNAFVDALDFVQLGIPEHVVKGGQLEYSPRSMVKLLIYGYAYGIQSARKLEQACHHNLSFIWLMGNLKPDYRTIARFRQKHRAPLKNILRQCVQLCIKWKLIDGNHLFIDSSCFRANASIQKSWNKKRCDETIAKLHEHIDTLVNTSCELDQEESAKDSLVKLKEQVADVEKIQAQLHELSTAPKEHQRTSINSTDADAVKVHSRQGTHAGYKAQAAVDGIHGLIVSTEVTSSSQDAHQLSRQVQRAEETLGAKPKSVCSDSGYYDAKDISKIDKKIRVVIPHQRQAAAERGKKLKRFGKEQFAYDKPADEYVCPAGNRLRRISTSKTYIRYHARADECRTCEYVSRCTNSPYGRDIYRSKYAALMQRLFAIYQSKKGRHMYEQRKKYCEHPYGHIKRNLRFGQFMLRGYTGVNAELSLVATAFNIRRMMTIVGITTMLTKFTS